MSRPKKLSESELTTAVAGLSEWSVANGKLHRELVFPSFNVAWGFVSRCALVAERMDHHPEWFNVFNKVVVDLSTHDAGGITQLDIDMAAHMNAIARSMLSEA